ncbi:MAG: polysaccharide deacetylase family protein [Nanobdellota archaeon]
MNYFTVDLEEWNSNKIFSGFKPRENYDYIKETTYPLIDVLEKSNVKATFFVKGTVLEKYPELIKVIHKKGHEIACHGYSHLPLYKLDKAEFEKEIIICKKLTKKITGNYPKGFRAPHFSLTNETKWALKILKKQGFTYDSSIFPLNTGFYGRTKNNIIKPYNICFDDIYKEEESGFLEYPIQILNLIKLPLVISGGFFFRLYPNLIIKKCINYLNNKKRPIIFFIHPWELQGLPKSEMPIFAKLFTHYRTKSGLKKLEKLLESNLKMGPINQNEK